jgi:dTDP-4-amino-4,6-dideoxygalactose transaminase
MNQRSFIPFHRPLIGKEEIDEVVATLKSGWLTTGPRTGQFESEFRQYVQAPYALAASSGTAALHLALAALGIGPGDEVITTPLTFCSTVHAIVHVGATPVLADVDRDGNIDPGRIKARITERTRAIVPVHLGGLPCDMKRIWAIARQHNLRVVEDAAHAAGAAYRGWPIGAGHPPSGERSDAVAFSFYATKNLTTGEGGMVTCHDESLYREMRVLCLHGISKDAWNRYTEQGQWFYEVVSPGFKYNLPDILSAIGIHQLRKLDRFIADRKELAARYDQELQAVEEVETPCEVRGRKHAWHLYAVRLNLEKLEIDRAAFVQELRQRRIGASVHFIPITRLAAYGRLADSDCNACPRALKLYSRLISLPLYPGLNEEEILYTARSVGQIAFAHRKTKVFAAGGAAF